MVTETKINNLLLQSIRSLIAQCTVKVQTPFSSICRGPVVQQAVYKKLDNKSTTNRYSGASALATTHLAVRILPASVPAPAF